MKNVFISLCIFVVIIIAMSFSIRYLNTTCSKLETNADKLEDLLNDEKWDEAYTLSNDLYDQWEKQYTIMPIFINHSEIDNLNNEIMKLTQYVKCKNKEESLASDHAIKFYLDSLKSLQKITIQNIF